MRNRHEVLLFPAVLVLVPLLLGSTPLQLPELGEEARAAVIAHLMTDCEIDEPRRTLDTLLEFSEELTPYLAGVLDGGPEQTTLAQFDRALDAQWRERQDFLDQVERKDTGLDEEELRAARAVTEEDYKELARRDFVSKFRQRAAVALGEIHTPDALQALRQTLEKTEEEDLKRVIRSALEPRERQQ